MVDMLRLPFMDMPPDHIVAWRAQQPIYNQTFQTRIQAWYALLKNLSGKKFALYISDSLEFASALFGGWLAEKTLYLPNNTLPNTCNNLCNLVDNFLGEFPAEYLPLIPTNQITVPINMNRLAPDLEGMVIYTSGSTGEAQAIPKRLAQLATEITTLEKLFGHMLRQAEILATVSHEHIYGLLFKILWPLTTGRSFHVRSAIFLEEFLPIINARECALVSTPAHLKRLPYPSDKLIKLKCLRTIFSSGSLLSLATAHAIQHLLGQTPIEVYGSSETGGIAWRQRHSEQPSAADEVWQPMPGINYRIIENEILEIRSPHLPDANWFRTADQAIAASNGFLLTGRIDRIVKLEGKRISLEAIERCLALSPLIAEALVLMLDKNQRQRIAAVIVLNTEGQLVLAKLGKAALNQLLRNNLSNAIEPIAMPRSWRYLDALPVNAQGKTTLAALTALFEQPRPTLPQQRLVEKTIHRAVFELTIPPNLFYFEGHFPNTPILPGVVQIDWAITFGRKAFELPPLFRGIQALKFQHIIQPDMIILLELQYDATKTTLSFRLYSSAGQHSSGRILFGNKEDRCNK